MTFRNVLKTTYNIILYICAELNLFHMKKGETFHIDPKPHLAVELDIAIVVAHYPAYCSKWNPVEHKAFAI